MVIRAYSLSHSHLLDSTQSYVTLPRQTQFLPSDVSHYLLWYLVFVFLLLLADVVIHNMYQNTHDQIHNKTSGDYS
jgi:hypothetical protein